MNSQNKNYDPQDLIKATLDNLNMFDIKFMISYEDKIDWNSLCKIRKFSTKEINLFGKSITWSVYTANHSMTSEEIMAGKKYMKQLIFSFLPMVLETVPEDIISRYPADLSWGFLFAKHKMSQDLIFNNLEYWADKEKSIILQAISKNPYINLDSEEYEKLKLYLKL